MKAAPLKRRRVVSVDRITQRAGLWRLSLSCGHEHLWEGFDGRRAPKTTGCSKCSSETISTNDAEAVERRLYRNRIDGNGMQSWHWVSTRLLRQNGTKISEFIAEKLAAGNKVTAGYTTTSIQDYHDHWIFWK